MLKTINEAIIKGEIVEGLKGTTFFKKFFLGEVLVKVLFSLSLQRISGGYPAWTV